MGGGEAGRASKLALATGLVAATVLVLLLPALARLFGFSPLLPALYGTMLDIVSVYVFSAEALNRRLRQADEQLRRYDFWLDNLIGFDLHGKTVSIVGCGRIGGVLRGPHRPAVGIEPGQFRAAPARASSVTRLLVRRASCKVTSEA